MQLRPVAAARFFPVLEGIGRGCPVFAASLQKNLAKYKNFICILEKMGYNKVE